jgi:hypothetical protein
MFASEQCDRGIKSTIRSGFKKENTMTTKKSTKSKKISVSKTQLGRTADEMEYAAVTTALVGQQEVMDGAQRMQDAADLAKTSTVLAMSGAKDVTRAEDAQIIADRLDVLSDAVAVAGVVDVAEGAAILAESEDVGVMSALVGMMSEDDLEHGLELARISGELQTASDLVAELQMPVLSLFLAERAGRLHEMSLEQIHVAISTEGVSQLLAASGTKIGELGENEVEEGYTRLEVAEAVEAKSSVMSNASDELAVQGVEELIIAKVVGQAAREEAIDGAREISEGSALVGAASAIDDVATSLKEQSE